MHEVGVFIKILFSQKRIEFLQRLNIHIEYQISQKKQKCFSHPIIMGLYSHQQLLLKVEISIYFTIFPDCVVRRLLNLKSRLTFKSFVFRRMQRLEGFSILNIKIKEKGKCRGWKSN